MNHCLVFFNGPTIAQYWSMPRRITEIGCNFIQQHRPMDHVCCFDHQMKDKIPVTPPTQYWCRNGHRGGGWGEVIWNSEETVQNSGMMAIRLAINLKYKNIWVLGCDWGTTTHSVYDHIYHKKKDLPQAPGRKKYTNGSLRQMDAWMEKRGVRVVADQRAPFKKPVTAVVDFWQMYEDLN
jgi:hypothetical protein